MYPIIFTRFAPDGETIRTRVTISEAPTAEKADEYMTEIFVAFCRDISHKPLTREHLPNGFRWKFEGLINQLHYISDEEKGETNVH